MIFNDNGKDRNSNPPRFFFDNSHQGNAALLSREGYSAFTSSFFAVWGIFLVFVIWIHSQVKVTNDLITTMSASAVELSALSLALLGILHEFNKKDHWFKLGLLLVGFLFASDCLLGFYLSVSWKDHYGLPQDVEITLFGIFVIAFLLQTDWLFLYTRLWRKLPRIVARSLRISSKFKPLNPVRLSIPFVFPLALIWVNNLTPVVTFLLLFFGAIIALLCLMLVTTFMLLRRNRHAANIAEDPIITYSRQIAIEQLESSSKARSLCENIIGALLEIQAERKRQYKLRSSVIRMVAEDVIVEHLRLDRDVTRRQDILDSLWLLERQNRIFGKGGGYWITPLTDQIGTLAENAKRITWFGTKSSDQRNESQLEWEKFNSPKLSSALAQMGGVPSEIIDEFVLSQVYQILYDPRLFHSCRSLLGDYVFVSCETKRKLQECDWTQFIAAAHLHGLRESMKGKKDAILDRAIVSSFSTKEVSPELSRIGIEIKKGLKLSKENEPFDESAYVWALVHLTDKSLLKFINTYLEPKFTETYRSLISSDHYRDAYYIKFSEGAKPSLMAILDEGVILNDSHLKVSCENRYDRLGYVFFLESLGLEDIVGSRITTQLPSAS